MAIIDIDSYAEIRAMLDVTLEEERLPDQIIGMAAYAGEAERRVIERVPGWATLSADLFERVRLAVVLTTAGLLAPAMPAITREDRLSYSYTRAQVDWAGRAAQLFNQAEEQLALVAPPAESEMTGGVRLFFDVAKTRRGGL